MDVMEFLLFSLECISFLLECTQVQKQLFSENSVLWWRTLPFL